MITFLALQDAVAPTFSYDLNASDVAGGWLVCFLTLAVFSFLYRDNPFYKIAEHIFVGVGTAWFTMEYYEKGIKKPIVEYIEGAHGLAEGQQHMLGGMGIDPSWAIAFRVIAMILSIMLIMRLFLPNSWMPRWPLAIMVGVYAALKMTGETQSKLVAFVQESQGAIAGPTAVATFGNIVFLVGLICALVHFVFTFKRTPLLAGVSRVGVITLMITFGSMFGFTVLGRIALLIERVADLDTYAAPDYALAGGSTFLTPPILTGAIIVILLALGALQRRGQGTAE